MGNCLLSWENKCQLSAATLTASADNSSLPVSNLKTPIAKVRYRTPAGTTGFTVTVDFGSVQSIDVLAIQQPDDAGGIDADNEPRGFMAATDTVLHTLDNVTAGAGSLLNSGVIQGNWVEGYGLHYYVLPAPVLARYWQFTINAISLASLGFVDLGLIWAGLGWRPTYNMIFGYQFGFEDVPDISVQPRGLIEFVDDTATRQICQLGFDSLTQAEGINSMLELQRKAKRQNQVLFLENPEDTVYGTRRGMIGRIRETTPISIPTFAQMQKTFTINQSL